MVVKRPAGPEQLPEELGSALLKSLSTQLAAIQLQGVGQDGDAIEVETSVSQLDQGDAVGGDAELIGYFGWVRSSSWRRWRMRRQKSPSKRWGMNGFLPVRKITARA